MNKGDNESKMKWKQKRNNNSSCQDKGNCSENPTMISANDLSPDIFPVTLDAINFTGRLG
jgi:hypothetical protein